MTARRFPTLALLASLALAGSYPTSGYALQDEPAAAEITIVIKIKVPVDCTRKPLPQRQVQPTAPIGNPGGTS